MGKNYRKESAGQKGLIPEQIKAVVFDCDGVLFDTRSANRAFYNRILKRFGKPEITDEQFPYVHMYTVDESVEFLFRGSPDKERALAYRRTMDYADYIREMKIEPHLKRLLKKLRNGGAFYTAIATNRTDTMDRVMSEFELEGFFDMVVTAEDVERPKPHPDQLIKIMDHFRIEPWQAVYIGDSKVDETAAETAGVPLVAFGNRDLTAQYQIESLKELEAILGIEE